MNLQSVPEARPPAASLVDHEDKRIAKAAQKVMAAEAALDAAWEANAEKAELRAKRDRLKKQLLAEIRAWAAEQGYEVAPSGQIPKAIMADYLDATSGGRRGGACRLDLSGSPGRWPAAAQGSDEGTRSDQAHCLAADPRAARDLGLIPEKGEQA